MTVAQVRVVIDVNCPNETSNAIATTRAKRDTVYEVLTDNIAYIRTRTILVAIITDTNDNAPVWSSDTPTYIGFPSYDLAQLIQVPYVYKFSVKYHIEFLEFPNNCCYIQRDSWLECFSLQASQ